MLENSSNNNKKDILPIIVFGVLIVIAIICIVCISMNISKDIGVAKTAINNVKTTISNTDDTFKDDSKPVFSLDNTESVTKDVDEIETSSDDDYYTDYNYNDDDSLYISYYLYDNKGKPEECRTIDMLKSSNSLYLSAYLCENDYEDYVSYVYFDLSKNDADKINALYSALEDKSILVNVLFSMFEVDGYPLDTSKSIVNYIKKYDKEKINNDDVIFWINNEDLPCSDKINELYDKYVKEG